MSGFVYLWFDKKHKRFYVGSHWGTPDDGYVCSSTWMRNSYRRRPQDFKRRIISTITTNRLDLLKEEQRWLNMIKDHELKGVRYYNFRKTVGDPWYSDEERKKKTSERIRDIIKEKYQTDPEYRKKVSDTTKTAMKSSEVRQNFEQGMASRKVNKELVSQQVKKLWEDPAYREMQISKKKGNPEYKKRVRKTCSKGTYHTPWGTFSNIVEATEKSPLNISQGMIHIWTKNLDRPLKLARKIPADWKGRTPRELGFGFEGI